MSKVVRIDKGNLSAELSITISKEDYKPKVDSELKKLRKDAHLKGFRRGRTPMGVIKRMYGPRAFMDVINDVVQRELFQYINDEKIELLGQPIPSEDQESVDFDIDKMGDYEFKFDIGFAPQFEVKGLDEDSTYDKYSVEVPKQSIDDDLDGLRKRLGDRDSVEDAIEENDVVTLDAEELDGDELKKDGWASTFDILVRTIANEEVKKDLISKTIGDKVRFNINELEEKSTPESVRKYLLNVEENDAEVEIGDFFEGTVKEIKRVVPAELNQEFFDKAFGEGTVSSEEEARKKIEEGISKYYDNQADSLLFRDLQDRLLEENNLDLPDEFLKNWLVSSDNRNTSELIDKEYDKFKKNLQWSLIKGKLVKQFDLEVKEEEIFEAFKDRVRGYFQSYGNELIVVNTANRLMEDQKQVNQMYEELMSDRLFEAMKAKIAIEPKSISIEDFEAEVQKAREEVAAAQASAAVEEATPELPEEEEEVTEDIEQ
jgi:trigger factor